MTTPFFKSRSQSGFAHGDGPRLHGVVCCVTSSGTSLLAKGGKIFFILIPQYVGAFLRRVIIITPNSRITPYLTFR